MGGGVGAAVGSQVSETQSKRQYFLCRPVLSISDLLHLVSFPFKE